LGEVELDYLQQCLKSGWVSGAGPFIEQFEAAFAQFCEVPFAIATQSGTAALHLALLALGIGPGDEVITPTLTFIATANAIAYTGATPVLVDSETSTWNLDPASLEKAITARTKAIVPVHLYGQPAQMQAILDFAAQHGLAVIEDTAHAHGARYNGQPLGGLGELGLFSFHGSKIMTTGEGGMVVTRRADLAERIRLLRNHGTPPGEHYWHVVQGYNYRMTNLQAALGLAQMSRITQLIGARQTVAQTYAQALANVPGLSLPPNPAWAQRVYWLYSILIDEERFGCERDTLAETLRQAGVETRPIFPPLHTQPVYAGRMASLHFPVADDLARRGLNLPSGPNLTPEAMHYIIAVILRCAYGSPATA